MLRLAIFLCLLSMVTVEWVNDWDMPFQFECPSGGFIRHIHSIHSNHREDRKWNLNCAPLPLHDVTAQNCYWTGYVNEYDDPVDFHCPANEFIAGMASEHNNHHEDRIFRFQCCDAAEALLHSCSNTGWLNDWDQLLDFIVPADKVLKGMGSIHDSHREDRRFKFQVCDIARHCI